MLWKSLRFYVMSSVIQYFAQICAIELLTYLYIPTQTEVHSDDES